MFQAICEFTLGRKHDDTAAPRVDANGYGLRVPSMVIGPYAKEGHIAHQTLSVDACNAFVEDVHFAGQRLDPRTDGRTPDPTWVGTPCSWAPCSQTPRRSGSAHRDPAPAFARRPSPHRTDARTAASMAPRPARRS